MFKRIIIIALLILSALAVSHRVEAAQPPRIASLDVSVWPEYDQPGVLVQYQGDLADAKPGEEQELSLLVPKGAGVGAACGIKADGNHTSETWKETDAGEGYTSVTYKLTDVKFHLEFYYNPLVGAGKSMEFSYKAASPVDNLILEIQHPRQATDFVLSPDAGESHAGNDGFTYHVYASRRIAAGQTVSSKISYTKTDPSPSVSGQKSSSAATGEQEAQQGSNTNLLIVVSVMAAALVLIGYFAFYRRSQPQLALVSDPTSYDEPRASRGSFCTACGNPLQPGDRFCGICGTRNRPADEA